MIQSSLQQQDSTYIYAREINAVKSNKIYHLGKTGQDQIHKSEEVPEYVLKSHN